MRVYIPATLAMLQRLVADGSLQPNATDLAGARFQGAHVARLAARLAGAGIAREAA